MLYLTSACFSSYTYIFRVPWLHEGKPTFLLWCTRMRCKFHAPDEGRENLFLSLLFYLIYFFFFVVVCRLGSPTLSLSPCSHSFVCIDEVHRHLGWSMCTDIVTEPFFIIIFRLLVAVNAQKNSVQPPDLKKKMLTFTSSKSGPCPAPNRGKKKRTFFFFVEIYEGMCAQQPATMTVVGPQVMRVLSSLFFFTFLFFFSSLISSFSFSTKSKNDLFFFHVHLWLSSGREVARPFNYWPVLDGSFWGTEKTFFFFNFYGWNTLRTTRSAWSILLPYLGLSHDRSDQRKWLWVIHEGR